MGSNTTRCYARLFRHGGQPVDLVGYQSGVRLHGPGSVVAATSSKSLTAPSGVWSLTVKPGDLDFERDVHAGDWIVMWWQRNGEFHHGTLGSIDSINEGVAIIDGATSKTYVLSGRDVGKPFERTQVWWNEYANFETNVGGRILGQRFGWVPGGTPDSVVRNIIDGFLGADGVVGGAWKLPKGLDYFGTYFVENMLAVTGAGKPIPIGVSARANPSAFEEGSLGIGSAVPLRGELYDEASLFQPNPGTNLFSLLREWSNPLLNELYFDILTTPSSKPDKPLPAVYIRERPFVSTIDPKSWFRLPTVSLARTKLGPQALARSDLERVNCIMLYASGIGQSNFDQYALSPPAYHLRDVREHGLCKFEQSTRFTGVGGRGSGPDWIAEIAEWHALLASWYGLNHEWRSGTIQVGHLEPRARVGRRLVVEDEDPTRRFQAYIESVTHSFQYPRAASTTLGVTRGFYGTDDELVGAVVDRTKEFQREDVAGRSYIESLQRAEEGV